MPRGRAARARAGVSRSASSATPAPERATAAAFAHWSTLNSGTTTSGTPWASAPSVVPWPPWPTIAAACGATASCGDPLLDVDVGRQRAQLRGVAPVADRQEHADGQRRERVDRGPVERRGSRAGAGRRSPTRTSRRRADRRCRATSRGSGGASSDDGVAEAMDGGHGDGRVLERLRDHREERGRRAAGRRPGRAAGRARRGPRPRRRRRASIEQRLDRREPERDADDRDAVELGDQRGGVLPESRTITSGRHSSTIARRPGSAAAVSRRAKYSPIIAALAVSRSICPNSPSSGIHCSGGGSSNGANGRPARSTLPACCRCAATSTSCPARSAACPNGARGVTCPALPRVVRRIRIDRQSHQPGGRAAVRLTGRRRYGWLLAIRIVAAHARRPPPALRPGRHQGARAGPDAQVRPARPRGHPGRAAQRGDRPRRRRRAARAAGLQDARRAGRPRALPALGRACGSRSRTSGSSSAACARSSA